MMSYPEKKKKKKKGRAIGQWKPCEQRPWKREYRTKVFLLLSETPSDVALERVSKGYLCEHTRGSQQSDLPLPQTPTLLCSVGDVEDGAKKNA